MPANLPERIPSRYFGLAALVLVALAYLALFRYDAYGVDEDAAHALLLNWSVADQLANPVSLLGAPDMRALLFIPLTFHWVGDIVAAKVLTLFLLLGLTLLLYRWADSTFGGETALIATGLLLLSPASIMQVDAVGKAPYLLLAFWLGCWFEERYRNSRHPLPSDYFLMLLATAFAVSLHPAGLALPAAIAWFATSRDMEPGKRHKLFIGMTVIAILVPVIRWGWSPPEWLHPPLPALAAAVSGPQFGPRGDSMATGMLVAGILLLVLALNARRMMTDIFSLALAGSVLLGALIGDEAWGMLCLVLMLYFGIQTLIDINCRISWGQGLLPERGIVILAIVMCATFFMLGDRYIRYVATHEIRSPSDEVISRLAAEAADHNKPFLAASQWPARSMLACRRDVFPLPKAASDPKALLANIQGLTHLAFDYRTARNKALSRQTSLLSREIETVALLPGGVVLRVRVTKPKRS